MIISPGTPWSVETKRTEVIEYRMPQRLVANDLVKMINAALTARQADIHRGRKPGEVLVRGDGDDIVAYYERVGQIPTIVGACCSSYDDDDDEDDE